MLSEAELITKFDHIFIMILDAIMERDLSSVKHYLSDEVENKYQKYIDDYINRNVIRLFDESNIKSTDIIKEYDNENGHNIEILIVSRYMDYFIDEDGNYVSGVNDHRIEKEHRIIFTKKNDTKELKDARRCPSCGNTLDINATGLCPYCNQTIDMSDYDYIVSEIDGI